MTFWVLGQLGEKSKEQIVQKEVQLKYVLQIQRIIDIFPPVTLKEQFLTMRLIITLLRYNQVSVSIFLVGEYHKFC